MLQAALVLWLKPKVHIKIRILMLRRLRYLHIYYEDAQCCIMGVIKVEDP
jgi:hypothetical protein